MRNFNFSMSLLHLDVISINILLGKHRTRILYYLPWVLDRAKNEIREMTYVEYNKLKTEVVGLIEYMFQQMKTKDYKSYALFLASAYKDELYSRIPPYVPFATEFVYEQYIDETRNSFLSEYLMGYEERLRHPDKINCNSVSYDINLQMMIYTHIWESKLFLKRLIRIANIMSYNGYIWDIPFVRKNKKDREVEVKKGQLIKDTILPLFKNSDSRLYEFLSSCYNSDLRNSFAHSMYTIDENCKKINTIERTFDGFESSIDFAEWETLFIKIALVGSQARLITIYNVMTPEEKAINGSLLELTYAVTEEVVDKMLQTANIPEEKRDIVQAIKDRSGNIPYMALLLIEAYKKKGNLQIENSDAVLSTILRGSGELTEQRLDVLRAISLFEPLGKDLGVSDEYDYVRKHCRIHNVNLRQDIVDNEFENTINDYEGRQLMEHEGSCIRIRPRPLAEWLTESWLKKYGSKIADIVDDINQQEEGLKRRLFRALDKRITGMPASKFTQQLFDELNNPQTGAFHNERIAFSKAGSQLFLSMGLVSPVMVAKNLYNLLSSKSTVWLRGYLDGDARRNLVWALENVCHSDEAFDDAAKSLGILAVAENEEIANNATGLFVQLFHLYLSGTKANLKQRITLLQSMREKEANFPLLLNAIDHAFMTGHFYRSNTNGLPDANDDYQPQVSEILFYWRDCAIVLKEITNQDNNLLEAMKEKFPKHISDLARFGAKDILFDILNFVGEKCNYDWMAARDSLASYLEFSFKGTDAYRAEFQTMLDKFAPKTFLGKLSSFVKDNHCRIGEDYAAYAQLMTERMKPFAEEFLKKRIFEHNDFLEILQDKEMNQIWFIRALAELTKNNDSQMELFQGMLRWVLTFPKEYAGNFIPTYIRIIGKNEIVLSFLGVIEHEGYYRLSASVIGVLDDKTFTGLLNLISKYHNGQYDDEGINQYLRMYNYQFLLDVFKIFDILHNGGVNEKAVGYPFLVDHLNYISLDELRKVRCLEKYKEILLNFDFKESSGYLNRQIVEAFGDVLRESSDKNFAFSIHQRIMDVLVKLDYIDNPFDNIYFTLLPKYQDVVLDDLLAKLGSSDSLLAYRMSLYLNLGSGLGSGKGPLFQCDIERLKEACFKYSDYLPARLANMCPVYEYTDKGKQDSFSKFFLWLCDNFGNQKQMLDEFSANMGTFSWCGVDGFSSFIAQRIPCIQPLLEHKNPTVREWAKEQLEAVRNEVMREQGQEAYERMIRG